MNKPLINELIDSKTPMFLVIGAPMPPFPQLKPIDRVLQAGVTFRYTENSWRFAEGKAYIAGSWWCLFNRRGEALDHQDFKNSIVFIGITDVEMVEGWTLMSHESKVYRMLSHK